MGPHGELECSKWQSFDQLDLEAEPNFLKRPISPVKIETKAEVYAKPHSKFLKFRGFIFGILAAINFSACSFVSKILIKKNYHPFNIALWKYQGLTLLGSFLLLYYFKQNKENIFRSIWPLNRTSIKNIFFLTLRATFGVCAMILTTNALKYLQLGDSAVIVYSTPIAVGLLARIFLRESLGFVSIILAIVTFLGVCVLARPPMLTGQEEFDSETLTGVGLAFTGMLFISSIFVILRHIREVHFSICISFYGNVAALACLFMAISFQVLEFPQSLVDWGLAVGNALLTVGGQVFLTLALQADFAGLVSLVRTGDVVFAFMWQMLLGVYPDALSLVGGGIVVSAILFTGFTKWLSTLPEDDPRRKKFSIILK